MERKIDPDSPVPLYHQIAEALRGEIERGDLRAGDGLAPVRRAAEEWGVNLHTVRHAYAALAREGLLEMRSARGTRVTEKAESLREARPAAADGGSEGAALFVTRVVHEARVNFGMDAGELATRITDAGGTDSERRPRVVVVECSDWQCASHAAELETSWQVDACPCPLQNEEEPDGDVVVATYFHYNDIRRRWPRLLGRVRFLTIHVAPEVEAWLAGAPRAFVVERDQPTAEAVAADLRAVFKRDVELKLVVTEDPASVLSEHPRERVLFSPRIWSDLSDDVRGNKHCAVVRYELDRAELERIARECEWKQVQVR